MAYHGNPTDIKRNLRNAVTTYCKRWPGWSRKKIAEDILHCDPSGFSRQLNPYHSQQLTLDTICQLLEIVDVSPNEIFGYIPKTASLDIDLSGLNSVQVDIVRKQAEQLAEMLRSHTLA